MYETILAPTDGSDHALRAARHASALASAFDADVHLLAAADIQAAAGPFSAGGIDADHRELFEQEAREWLGATEEAIADGVAPRTVLRDGHPAETIAEYAEEIGADLLTMGTHGRSGVSRYVLGSVTERVLRITDAPVLTVKAEDRSEPAEPIEEVLVPTDGSERAGSAIDHGIALAENDGARVHAVSVLDEPVGLVGEDVLPDEIQAAIGDQARVAIDEIAAAAEDAGLEALTELRTGEPAAALLEYADEVGIDVVAMGTQGRTGLDRYLLGSTTDRVVRHAPVPVMAVNAREG